MFQYIQKFIEEQVNRLTEIYLLPGFVFVLLIIIGVLYLLFGIKIYKFILGLIAFSAAGIIGYYFSENLYIAAASAVIAGIIAYLLQYIFLLIFSGIAIGGIIFFTLFFTVNIEEIVGVALIGAFIGIVVGIYLAIKLFRVIVIFTTSAFGAAVAAPSFWILYEKQTLTDIIDLKTVQFDPLNLSITFTALLFLGLLVQATLMAGKKEKPAEQTLASTTSKK